MVKSGIYQHYKGQFYRVLSIVKDSETERELVLYQCLYDKFDFWVRPLEMFLEVVLFEGKKQPRFKFVSSKNSPLDDLEKMSFLFESLLKKL